MEKGSLKIDGIENEEDVQKILQALNSVWGVREAEVSLANKKANFSYDEKAASHVDFLQAVKDIGFDVAE